MEYIKSHKDLFVWQKSMQLAKEIYRLTKLFPQDELYGIISQMRRSVISVPSNIAEGYGRKSRKEFKQFLLFAYGSVQELETQLILAKELKLAHESEFIFANNLLAETSKMLYVLISKIKLQIR